MKPGLTLPDTISATDITAFKNDPRKYGIKLRIAMQEKSAKEFKIILDKWRQSGHTIKSSDELIKCIRGSK